MELTKIEATIEAILFSFGDAVHINKLSEVIGQDKKTLKKIIVNMRDKYESEDRGIQLIELEECYQLCTKPEYFEHVKLLSCKTKHFNLTDVLIETLSIIAYKQPITKAHIEGIRGVNSNHSVNKLVEYQLVTELGRMDAPGRPILFGTSQNFLRFFGLQSIDELPILEEEQLSILEDAANKEIQLKLVE